MQKVAKFMKVSFLEFSQCFMNTFSIDEADILRIYDTLKLPCRATVGSAGYDFYSPMSFSLQPGEMIKIPTGIRASIEDGWVLQLFPRSGLGFKYRLQLNNTVGIIDSDYFHSDNEGHIQIKLTNDSKDGKTLYISEGQGFAQGIFLPFGITEDDDVSQIRNGGFGSTNQVKNL